MLLRRSIWRTLKNRFPGWYSINCTSILKNIGVGKHRLCSDKLYDTIIAVIGCPQYFIPANIVSNDYGTESFRKLPQVRMTNDRMTARAQTQPKKYMYYTIRHRIGLGKVYCKAKWQDILPWYCQWLVPRTISF